MAASREQRERWLWLVASIYLLALYLSLYSLQFALDALRARGQLRLAIAAAFAVTGLLAVGWGLRQRWNVRQWSVAAAGGALFVLLGVSLEVIQERLHLVEYGLLGALLRAAWRTRWEETDGGLPPKRRWLAAAAAVAATAGAGWLDEAIQWLLPNRVYDLRDVVLNAASGALAVAVLEAVESVGSKGNPREQAP